MAADQTRSAESAESCARIKRRILEGGFAPSSRRLGPPPGAQASNRPVALSRLKQRRGSSSNSSRCLEKGRKGNRSV